MEVSNKQAPAGPFRTLRRTSREKTKLARVTSMSVMASQHNTPKLKSCFSSGNLSSMNGPSSNTSVRKNVGFRNIEIREYEIDIGDNPCVGDGPPLSLGWKYEKEKIIDLNEFETLKGPSRPRNEMRVPRNQREWLIRASGVTNEEIENSIRDVNITKKGRLNTATSSDAKEKTLEVLESAGRKFRRFVGSNKQKKVGHPLLWNTLSDSGKANTSLRQVCSMNDLRQIRPPQEEKDAQHVSRILGLQNATLSCCDLKSAAVSSESCCDLKSNDVSSDFAVISGVSVRSESAKVGEEDWGLGFDDDDDDDDPVAF
jgi:hypothetical protein